MSLYSHSSSSFSSEILLSCFPSRSRKPAQRNEKSPPASPVVAAEQAPGSPLTGRKESIRRNQLVTEGNEFLREASDLIFQHRQALGEQAANFDSRWAELFHLRPILTKLTKGRQKPDDFHANTERLLRDVQSAVKEAQDRRMATHGTEGGFFTPNVPRSVASMARSIRSSISSKIKTMYQNSPSYRNRELAKLSRRHTRPKHSDDPPPLPVPALDDLTHGFSVPVLFEGQPPSEQFSRRSHLKQSIHRYPPFSLRHGAPVVTTLHDDARSFFSTESHHGVPRHIPPPPLPAQPRLEPVAEGEVILTIPVMRSQFPSVAPSATSIPPSMPVEAPVPVIPKSSAREYRSHRRDDSERERDAARRDYDRDDKHDRDKRHRRHRYDDEYDDDYHHSSSRRRHRGHRSHRDDDDYSRHRYHSPRPDENRDRNYHSSKSRTSRQHRSRPHSRSPSLSSDDSYHRSRRHRRHRRPRSPEIPSSPRAQSFDSKSLKSKRRTSEPPQVMPPIPQHPNLARSISEKVPPRPTLISRFTEMLT